MNGLLRCARPPRARRFGAARPRGRRVRAAALAALVAAALATTGCASLSAPAPSSAQTAANPPRIMVTLAGNYRPQWDRITVDLSLSHSLRIHQRWRMRSLDLYCVVFELGMGRSTELAVRRLAADHRVETAEAIQTYRTLAPPQAAQAAPAQAAPATAAAAAPADLADPYAHLQHATRSMRVRAAHRWATGDGVRVAVIDTGIDVGHPDLRGRIDAAQNFVDRGEKHFTSDVHGTAVAGVLAAAEDNGTGIAGVAPRARLLALKACWPTERGASTAECDNYTLSKAIDWALAEESQVLNLSLTGPPDPVLVQLLDLAVKRGVTVVAAAQEGPDPGFPASHPGVIPVRASDDPSAASESRGVSAPGVDILTTTPGGGYEFFSGSSMAAAHVSGVVALMLEKRPLLRPPDVAQALREQMRELGAATAGAPRGAPGSAVAVGRTIDACGTLAGLLGTEAALCDRPADVATTGRGAGD